MAAAFALLFGAALGSFLNVVADRLPAGQFLSTPRSHCPVCKTTLRSRDMVPVLSYLWLRGRCAHCKAVIPARLAMVEAATGLLFLSFFLWQGLSVEALVLSLVGALFLLIAIIDMEHGLVLNSIVFPSIVGALVLAPFWTELGLTRTFFGSDSMAASLFNSLVAGGGAFLVFLAVVLLFPKGMGWGDVKLAALLGLLVGLPGIVVGLWMSAVAGGLVGGGLLLLRIRGRKDALPFAPFMTLGAVIALPAGRQIFNEFLDLTRTV